MPKQAPSRKRGRPQKFGRPAQVVALTLPQETVRGLRRVDPDLGWAIVSLLETKPGRAGGARTPPPDSELVQVAGRRSLIVVNRDVMKHLPGVSVIPLHGNRGLLALDPGGACPTSSWPCSTGSRRARSRRASTAPSYNCARSSGSGATTVTCRSTRAR